MKRSAAIIIILALFLAVTASAVAAPPLLDMRSKIFKESKDIKSLITGSKDILLINSMWDSCVLTLSQLDAYFSMLGIYNTIAKDNLTKGAVDYLLYWLKGIKDANDLNIKGLSSLSGTIEPKTKIHLDILVGYFKELNNYLTAELNKLALLKDTVKK